MKYLGKRKSVCPVLGQIYPKMVDGDCPLQFQRTDGKKIPVTYIGTPPYILGSNAQDGTDIRILSIFSRRYNFEPVLTPTPQYLIMSWPNGTKYGKKYQVGNRFIPYPYV